MELNDPKLKTIAALHEINSDAIEAIEQIDKKLDEAPDETITVKVEELRRIRMILFAQKYSLSQFVEHQAEMDDFIDSAIAKLTRK